MQVVPDSKRLIALLALALTLAIGVGAAWALARGAADPPRAPVLMLNENRQDRLVPAATLNGVRLYHLADAPIIDSLPFTIELEAVNEGEPRSAWGVWITPGRLESGDGLPIMISDQGYILSPLDSTALEQAQFMHISAAHNRLTLHVDAEGNMTLRVNDEVVRALDRHVTLPLDYGVALLGNVRLQAFSARVYTTDEL